MKLFSLYGGCERGTWREGFFTGDPEGQLSFRRTQSRVVIGLLTGNNTLKRHLHLMGLRYSLLCRRCGAEVETSAHILCKCEALASLRHTHLGSFFMDPEDVKRV